MKILHIINVPDSAANGIRQCIMRLQQSQRLLGHDVYVLNVFAKRIFPLKDSVFDKNILSQIDVVIFHSVYCLNYLVIAKMLRRTGIPYLVELHGALSETNFRKNKLSKKIALFFAFNSFLKAANSIIYLNEGEKRNSIVTRINPNAVIIPNGCDIDENVSCEKEFCERKVEIVFLGRMNDIYHKGIDILIEALQLAEQKGVQEVYVSFYGPKSKNKQQQDWFEHEILRLQQLARYCGGIYGEDKTRMLYNSDILILPSRSEGMPMVVLEALACGVPCIVSKTSNMCDIISQYSCGWVIEELTPEGIVDAVNRAVEDLKNNRKQLSENAFRAAKAYSWKEIANISVKKYQQMIKDKTN